MAHLIDLDLLNILYEEAQKNRHEAIRQSLNYPPQSGSIADSTVKKMSDAVFTHISTTYAQAEIVYKNLEHLHGVCTDFAAGQFQSYIDTQQQYQEEHVPIDERGTYTPFVELDIPFNIAYDFPLPRRIEQFPELLGLCQNFNKVRTLKREGLNPFFGDEPYWYEYTNEQGETNIVPPSLLPQPYLAAQIATETSLYEAVEKSLDHYNEFYSLLLESYLENVVEGDELQALAAKILTLYR